MLFEVSAEAFESQGLVTMRQVAMELPPVLLRQSDFCHPFARVTLVAADVDEVRHGQLWWSNGGGWSTLPIRGIQWVEGGKVVDQILL
jgi:hypothetical protein